MGVYKNLLFKDPLTGASEYCPDKGKWFIFYVRQTSGVVFTSTSIQLTQNGCKFAAAVNNAGWGAINLLSRAEFKVPFKLRFTIKPTLHGFYVYLVSPDVRDGFFLNSHVYGKWLAVFYGTTADSKFKLGVLQNNQTKTNTSTATWSLGTEYVAEVEVTPYVGNPKKFNVDLTVKKAETGETVWQINDWCDSSISETLRCCLCALAQASGAIEFYAKGLLVFGNQNRKVKAVVSAVTGNTKRVITEDVIDFRIALRDGSHPQASLTIKNEGNKYAELGVKTEIEIRGGTEAILYLLFRGYIEAPERSYPPSRLKVESGKGYAKRLDYREAYGREYDDVRSGYIVRDLIATYYADVFTADNVSDGAVTDQEYHGVPISKAIKELAEANSYLWGVDFNKDVYFIPYSKAQSKSSIAFKSKSDQLTITAREVDEIINYVRQVGKTVSGYVLEYTAFDSTSESLYWRRDKTFKDISLRTQRAVQTKAEGLLAKYKDVSREITLSTNNIVPLELYSLVNITNSEVGLNSFEAEVKAVEWSYSARGVRTSVYLGSRGFKLADALSSLQEGGGFNVLLTVPGGYVIGELVGSLDKAIQFTTHLDFPTLIDAPKTLQIQLTFQTQIS